MGRGTDSQSTWTRAVARVRGRKAELPTGFVGSGEWTVVDERGVPVAVRFNPTARVISDAAKNALFETWRRARLRPARRWLRAKRRIDERTCPLCRGRGTAEWPGAQLHLGICAGCGGCGMQFAYEWGWTDDTNYVCPVCKGTGARNATRHWPTKVPTMLVPCDTCWP